MLIVEPAPPRLARRRNHIPGFPRGAETRKFPRIHRVIIRVHHKNELHTKCSCIYKKDGEAQAQESFSSLCTASDKICGKPRCGVGKSLVQLFQDRGKHVWLGQQDNLFSDPSMILRSLLYLRSSSIPFGAEYTWPQCSLTMLSLSP